MPKGERFEIVIIGANKIAEKPRYREMARVDSDDGALSRERSREAREESRGEQ
jgi:hypothetical protein